MDILVIDFNIELREFYLGQVLGYSSPSVSIWNFGVLQVHRLLPHIFIQKNRTIMRS